MPALTISMPYPPMLDALGSGSRTQPRGNASVAPHNIGVQTSTRQSTQQVHSFRFASRRLRNFLHIAAKQVIGGCII